MARYSKTAGKKIAEVLHEMKEGKLKTGNGKKVTSVKHVTAIGLSEAREEDAKVPVKKEATTKTASKKTASKKVTAKKAVPKKSSGKSK